MASHSMMATRPVNSLVCEYLIELAQEGVFSEMNGDAEAALAQYDKCAVLILYLVEEARAGSDGGMGSTSPHGPATSMMRMTTSCHDQNGKKDRSTRVDTQSGDEASACFFSRDQALGYLRRIRTALAVRIAHLAQHRRQPPPPP